MTAPWLYPGAEPPLDELLADPIVQLLMRRDGVRAHDMQNHLQRHHALSGPHARTRSYRP